MIDIVNDIAGRWIKDGDMDPATNVAGRRFWAPGAAVGDNIEGTYRGYWPTHRGEKPQGLYWFFPTDITRQEPKG